MAYKLPFLLIILTFLTISVKGQEFFAGPLLGASFTQVDGDSYTGFNKVGLKVGGFVGRKLWKDWELQMEIMYIQKGSRKAPDVENEDYVDYLIAMDYLQIPLIARYNLNKFSFEGGISYGSLLNVVEKVDGEEIPEDMQVPFKENEFASIVGISYQVTNRLKANMRFSYSLNRVRIPFDGKVDIYEPHWGRKTGQYNDVITIAFYYNLFQNYP